MNSKPEYNLSTLLELMRMPYVNPNKVHRTPIDYARSSECRHNRCRKRK